MRLAPRLRVAVGTEIAQAQDDLGANIANTVTNAVSSVATNSSSGGTLIGGVSTETAVSISASRQAPPSRMRAAATITFLSSAKADTISGNPRGGFAVNVRQT